MLWRFVCICRSYMGVKAATIAANSIFLLIEWPLWGIVHSRPIPVRIWAPLFRLLQNVCNAVFFYLDILFNSQR